MYINYPLIYFYFSPGHICSLRYNTLAIVYFEYYSVNYASRLRTKVLEGGVNSKWDERGKTNGNPDSCDRDLGPKLINLEIIDTFAKKRDYYDGE